MPDILICCPLTREAVPTGLDTETVVLASLPSVDLPFQCPACGRSHYWKPADAWAKGASPRNGRVLS